MKQAALSASAHMFVSKSALLPPIHKDVIREDFEIYMATQESRIKEVERLSKFVGPSMFEQLHMSRAPLQMTPGTSITSVLSTAVQIRAPPPMTHQPLPARTAEPMLSAPVIVEGGKVYQALKC
ncbi:unnamed protein product [Cuscuta epithymum]|uniref:Uncharacterized protein n=1 Tax=Cuscuta epithymum TaxID=186058 RepID=A0AAV0DR67_9ASTE|nr:unnamed protein product [Cuscuta epithymum]